MFSLALDSQILLFDCWHSGNGNVLGINTFRIQLQNPHYGFYVGGAQGEEESDGQVHLFQCFHVLLSY